MERTIDKQHLIQREHYLRTLFLEGLAGDDSRYREFLIKLGAHVRGFLRKWLAHDPTEIEDLVQEVLLAVHNARHTYLPSQPLTAWVQAIARYKLVDHFRSNARVKALTSKLDQEEGLLFAAEDHEQAQASRDLKKLLKVLPEKQRLPILHVKIQGMSVEETASLTGLSIPAVKVGIHRGLKVLAKLIKEKQQL